MQSVYRHFNIDYRKDSYRKYSLESLLIFLVQLHFLPEFLNTLVLKLTIFM
jgi:hypothetical protein